MLPRGKEGVMFARGVIYKGRDDVEWTDGMISGAR
jgi:hypothetical protein